VANGPVLQPMIVLSANDVNDHDDVFTHELTHVISFSIIHHQPPWLAEGIGTFFGSMKSHDGRVEVGMPREDFATTLRKEHAKPVAAMFACHGGDCLDHQFYATAWAMFTFLVNEHPDELGRYLQLLNQPSSRKAAHAWADAFPQLTPEAFDHALADWIAFGAVRLPKFDIQLHRWRSSVRPLADPDILAVRALAEALFVQDKARARASAATAIAAERTNLLAQLVAFAIDRHIDADDARALATAHADDWRAWYLVAHATQPTPESAAAQAKACELAGKDPGVETPDGLCD
jgi:hypothetical protein